MSFIKNSIFRTFRDPCYVVKVGNVFKVFYVVSLDDTHSENIWSTW